MKRIIAEGKRSKYKRQIYIYAVSLTPPDFPQIEGSCRLSSALLYSLFYTSPCFALAVQSAQEQVQQLPSIVNRLRSGKSFL